MNQKYEYYFCVPSIIRKLFKDAGYEIPIQSDIVKDNWDGEVGHTASAREFAR